MNVFGFQIGSEDDPMTGEATAPSYFDEALGEFGSAAGAFAMHAGQGLTLNFGDELAAALMTPYEVLTSEDNGKDFWSRVGDTYSGLNQSINDELDRAKAEHPYASIAGELAGGVALGVATAPIMPSTIAVRAGNTLRRIAFKSAVEGSAFGALNGAGSGRTFDERLSKTWNGALLGLGLGFIAPKGVEIGQSAVKKATDYVRAWRDPANAVDSMVSSLARKAGTTLDDIAAALESAAADGQTQFAFVDAAGPGARNTLAKLGPTLKSDSWKALETRHNSQAERLGANLTDGFGAEMTAEELEKQLVKQGAPAGSIEALNAGKRAQDIRADPARTIPDYLALSAENQSNFRVGYADAPLSRLRSSTGTPLENKAAMFRTERTQKELPAFALPGKGGRLMRQIGREDEMFKTTDEVLRAERNAVDAGSGRDFVGAAADVVGGNIGQGVVRLGAPELARIRSPKLDQAIGDALLSTDANLFRAMSARSAMLADAMSARRARILPAVRGGGAAYTSEDQMQFIGI